MNSARRGPRAVVFGMDDARIAAWRFAQTLAPLTPTQQLPLMADRDDEMALLGNAILSDGLVERLIHAKESPDVAANIRALAQGEFTITIPAVVTPPAAAASPAPAS